MRLRAIGICAMMLLAAVWLSGQLFAAPREFAQGGNEKAPSPNQGEEQTGQGEESAGGDPHEEEGHASNPLDFQTDLAIWTAVIFLALLFVLGKFAWGPISEGLQKREQGILDNIAAAERRNEEAKVMMSQYEAKLAAAAGEVREIIEEARRDAEHTKNDIIEAAGQEASLEKDRALTEINTARDQALKDLAERSADMAVDLAGRIMQSKLSKDDHSALIKDAVGKFVASDPGRN